MPYFALTDSDWPWDDMDEGRPLIVYADTPEEAVKKASELELKLEAEAEGIPVSSISGGVHWMVAQLVPIGMQGVDWENGVPNFDDEFTNYPEHHHDAKAIANSLPDGHTILEQADMPDGRVSQTVKEERTDHEYERIVSADEAYADQYDEEDYPAPEPEIPQPILDAMTTDQRERIGTGQLDADGPFDAEVDL